MFRTLTPKARFFIAWSIGLALAALSVATAFADTIPPQFP